MAKYSIPDDHEWADEQEDEPADPPANLKDHEIEVVYVTDPTERGGYGREKYTVHIGHDFDDAPVAVFATKHRWRGNYWRETEQIDWHDLPGAVKQQVAAVVDCDGVTDLHPGHRVVGEGGRETWRRYPGDDAYGDKCPSCAHAGYAEDYLPDDQRACQNRKCAVAAFSVDAEPRTDGGRVTVEDLNECWCCGGLTDAPSLCGPCSDAGCNRFTDECESNHIPVERLGDGR